MAACAICDKPIEKHVQYYNHKYGEACESLPMGGGLVSLRFCSPDCLMIYILGYRGRVYDISITVPSQRDFYLFLTAWEKSTITVVLDRWHMLRNEIVPEWRLER